jgi:hypothetical protein
MKRKAALSVLAVLFFTIQFSASQTASKQDPKITVMNPRGIQPPIRRIPMPERQSIAGKTVYIVDTKYANTKPFVNELYKILQERYPKTNWVLRDKRGMYMTDDPDLWEEIKEKAVGMIMPIGH